MIFLDPSPKKYGSRLKNNFRPKLECLGCAALSENQDLGPSGVHLGVHDFRAQSGPHAAHLIHMFRSMLGPRGKLFSCVSSKRFLYVFNDYLDEEDG